MNALTSSPQNNSFASHFDAPLPRDLRNQADEMSWTMFNQRFSSTNGPIRLGSWDSRIARGGRTTYDATFGIGDTIHSATATTHGPIDALTSMLYDAGIHIEILSFHQQTLPNGHSAGSTPGPNGHSAGSTPGPHGHSAGSTPGPLGGHTATFVLCEFDGRQEWSMAIDSGSTQASIRAIISAANLLHSQFFPPLAETLETGRYCNRVQSTLAST